MAGPQLGVHLAGVGEPDEVSGQADLVERRSDDLGVVLLAAEVDADAIASYKGLITVGPCSRAAAMMTRTGAQERSIMSR